LTGAAEAHKGEAVENEASNFVNGIATVAMASAVGKAPEHERDQTTKKTKLDDALPDPTEITMKSAEGKTKASGGLPTDQHNKAKDPVVNAIWGGMRPAMRGIEDFCDNYERIANALQPTVPYPQHSARIRLAACVAPLILVTAFVPVQYLCKGGSFAMGLAFFSDPYMKKAWTWFVTHYPDWMEMLKLEKCVPRLTHGRI
jgi:hypothetical protein